MRPAGLWLYIVSGQVFFPYSIFFFKNVPGVLKRIRGGGGGILGCLGRPTPPPGGRAGSENGQQLSSGNLGGGRRQKIKNILTKS